MGELNIKNLTVKFGGVTAVKNLSMDIKEDEIHSLIGPNGAGKTTVFNTISRIVSPQSGEIYYDGTNILSKHPHSIIQLGIGRTFQNLMLFKFLNILENMLIGYHRWIKTNIFEEFLSTNRVKSFDKKGIEKAIKIAEELGFKNYLYHYPLSVPYGIQKLVDIGRILMADPEILLLDEPTSGLTTTEKVKLKETLIKLKEEKNLTLFLIEHDMSVVMDISDTVTVINFGEKIAEGKPEEIRNNNKVIEAYLGEEENVKS